MKVGSFKANKVVFVSINSYMRTKAIHNDQYM